MSAYPDNARLRTAWEIGEEAAAKKPKLGRFGCKSVQRVSIRPVTARVNIPHLDGGSAA